MRGLCFREYQPVDLHVAGDEQLQSMVRELSGRDQPASGFGLLPDGDEIPTGEELGAEIERFLAERARPAGTDDPPT
jgi:hypothetical protein